MLRDNTSHNQAQADTRAWSRQDSRDPLLQVSQVLIKELQKITPSSTDDQSSISRGHGNQRKRQRLETDHSVHFQNGLDFEDGSDLGSLPQPEILSLIIDKYFRVLQHWIPFLHQKRFENQLNDTPKKERNAVVLHAITCATLRFVRREDHGMSELEASNQVRHSRQVVMLTALC